MPWSISGDPLKDFESYDADRQRELDRLPICCHCEEPILDEYCYDIDGDLICEDCLTEYYRKHTDDYID